MSDTVLISLIQSIGTLLGLVASGYIAVKLAQTNKTMESYHKEVNSKFDQHLKTEKELGNAEGNLAGRKELKAEQKANK